MPVSSLPPAQSIVLLFLRISLFSACFAMPAAADNVTLCRGEMHTEHGGRANGPGPETRVMECVLKRMGHQLSTLDKPWLRCIRETEQGLFAGVYPLADMPALLQDMKPSDPLAIEKWYWLAKGELVSPRTARFAAIRGSNQHAWLLSQGFTVSVEAESIRQLFGVLDTGRIDAIIGTDQELAEAHKRGFRDYFVRYLPLKAYFADRFVEKSPGFLADFNTHIHACQPKDWVMITAQEKETLAAYIERYKVDLVEDFIPMLTVQNVRHQGLTQADILRLDGIWIGSRSTQRTELIERITESPAAYYLKTLQQESQGSISEIFIMDNKGLLVASSDIATDYWQGDEDKFRESFGRGAKAFFIDGVQFDPSSKQFLSQISTTIVDATGQPIGALMIGVNVEKALSQDPVIQHPPLSP